MLQKAVDDGMQVVTLEQLRRLLGEELAQVRDQERDPVHDGELGQATPLGATDRALDDLLVRLDQDTAQLEGVLLVRGEAAGAEWAQGLEVPPAHEVTRRF